MLLGDLKHLLLLATGQAGTEQLPAQPVVLRGAHKIHLALGFIHCHHLLNFPVAAGHWRQRAILGLVDVEVPEAAALAGPEEAALVQRLQHVVHIHPHLGLLREQGLHRALLWVQLQHRQLRLLSVQHLRNDGAIRHPLHPCQVQVLSEGLGQVKAGHRRRRARGRVRVTFRRHHAQLHHRVLLTREGIPVVLLGAVAHGV
mmetsp:Transcript_132123/g.313182  ORF Transcript_132123/g.313182 Transcript_132123/m.313182 type:complete len:201 (+) Transcript_132123:987-1589(+)